MRFDNYHSGPADIPEGFRRKFECVACNDVPGFMVYSDFMPGGDLLSDIPLEGNWSDRITPMTKEDYKEKEKAYNKARWQTLEYKAWNKARRQRPEYRDYQKVYKQTPEYKAYMKEYDQTPERKARKKANDKARNETPERKAYMKAYNRAYYLQRRVQLKGI